MRRLGSACIVSLLVLGVCSDDMTPEPAKPTTTSSVDVTGPEADSAAVGPSLMGLALRRLIDDESGDGGDGYRFSTVLVWNQTDPSAGVGFATHRSRPLTESERSEIELALEGVGSMRWIDNPGPWRTAELEPVIEGSAIVGVGDVIFDEEGALVPVSLWCGGLCGTWFTYRLRVVDGEWTVIGPEGPVIVA